MSDKDTVDVLIETPKGSTINYEYDEKSGAIKEKMRFSGGFSFIYNYGFIPKTKSEDGDCLDCFVLGSDPIEVKSLIKVRPIGMIDLIDKGEQDNKIIAVLANDSFFEEVDSLEDLLESPKEEFMKFFKEIAIQKKKKMKVRGFYGKGRALEEIKNHRVE